MKNGNLSDDLTSATDECYGSVFTALNKEEESYITNVKDQVKSKIYSILKERYFLLKNEYYIDNINFWRWEL